MRHLSFSRSTSKRLQKLTAFLTALAIIAGFLPLSAVKVFAGTNYDFNFKIDDHCGSYGGGLAIYYQFDGDEEWTPITDSLTADYEGKQIESRDGEGANALTIKVEYSGKDLEDVYLSSAPDATERVSLAGLLENQDPAVGFSMEDNKLSFTYHYDDFTSANRCFTFEFYGTSATYQYYYKIETQGPGSITIDDTIPHTKNGNTYKVYSASNSLTVTLNPTGSNDQLGAVSLLQEDGGERLEASQGINKSGVSYTAGGDTVTFSINEGTKFDNIVLEYITHFSSSEDINYPLIVNNDTVIYGCTLTLVEGGSISIKEGANLMLGGGASIKNISATNFSAENNAMLSFFDNTSIPTGITLCTADENEITDNPTFDGYSEFFYDSAKTKWIQRDFGPGGDNFGPDEEHPYYFEIHTDGHGHIEFDGTIPNRVQQNDYQFCSSANNLSVTVVPDYPDNGDKLEEIRIATDDNPEHDIVLKESNDFSSNDAGVSFNKTTNVLTFTIPEGETEFRGIVLVFTGAGENFGPNEDYPYYFEIAFDGNGIVDLPENSTLPHQLSGDGKRLQVCSNSNSITVVLSTASANDSIEEIRLAQDDNPENDIVLKDTENYSSETNGVLYNSSDNTLTLTIPSGSENKDFNNIVVLFTGVSDPGPGPQGSPSAYFPGSTGFNDTDTSDNIITVTYPHGTLTVELVGFENGKTYKVTQDEQAGSPVVIEYDGDLDLTVNPDQGYSTKIYRGNEIGTLSALIDKLTANTEILITFEGPSFKLEVGGQVTSVTPVEDKSTKTVTIECENGNVVVSGYANLLDIEPVTPGGSSIPGAYKLKIEGDAFNIKFIPNTGYIYGIREDGTIIYDDNGELSYTGISRDSEIKIEAMFEQVPLLKIAEGYTYNTQTGGMDFGNGNIVTILGDTKPNNPQQFNETYADVSFSIETGEGYSCFVSFVDAMGNMSADEYVTGNTYTLSKNKLLSLSDGSRNNTITFTFVQLTSDQLAKVKFDGVSDVTSNGDFYYVSYIDNLKGIQLGTVKISKDSIVSYDDATSTFTIKQVVSSLELTITPNAGYTPSLVEYGPAYGENQTETGEWSRELTLTNTNGTYSYSLPVNPQSTEPINLRFSFNNTQLIKSTVTYTYTGEPASIAIGGNEIPSGVLTNKEVIYKTPLVPDSEGKVEFNLAVPFNLYMSELKINDVDYSSALPDTYDELLAAFGSQHTNISVMVPVADSYKIETTVVDAKFDEDPTKTTLAVGNFLWFYDENACDNKNDMVKNATLKIVSVEFNGVTYSGEELFVGAGFPGSGLGEAKFNYMEWDENIKDGEIIDGKVVGGTVVNGEAVLPAGSIVTIKLIPDYGTQLLGVGINDMGFKASSDEMYTYTFTVGPGNFHLQADFEPVEDVVETSATAISDGSISLGADTVDNGSAVLFVGDANLDNTTKTSFDNKAATESMEIASYLDISLDKVVYQGVSQDEVSYSGNGKNVWSEELNDLSSPATVTLQLTEELDSTNVKVLHEKHDGTLEIIDATYDAATQSITFQTSSFSNYAIAYEKNAPVTYYDLWVGNTQVTSANASNVLNQVNDEGKPTVVFDASTNTLTFNDAVLTEVASPYYPQLDAAVINTKLDNLNIEGTLTIEAETNRGIQAQNGLTLNADITSNCEICATTITIESGTIILNESNIFAWGPISIESGVTKIEVKNPDSKYCGTLSAQGEITIEAPLAVTSPEGEIEIKEMVSGWYYLCVNGNTARGFVIEPAYTVTVNNGTADKTTVPVGETVTITANSPETGKAFDKWVVEGPEGFSLEDDTFSPTTFTMPAGNVELTATYKDRPYSVIIHDGTADCTRAIMGTTVTITADPAPAGKIFDTWVIKSGGEIAFADATSATTTFTMPAELVELKATYKNIEYYDLWIGDIQVTSANASNVLGDTGDPTVVYDADTNTLTLNGATIVGPNSDSVSDNDADGGIVYTGATDFTLNVIGGTSTVTGGNTKRNWSAGLLFGDPTNTWSYALDYDITINIDDGATLTLTGGAPDTTYAYATSYGLDSMSSGKMTITGSGTLNAYGGESVYSYGIQSNGDLSIDGPTVNASGADSYFSTGISSGGNIIISSGNVTATGGSSSEEGAKSYGFYGNEYANKVIAFNGGTVTATGETSALSMSATLGDGVTAGGSTNIDGSGAVSYVAADNNSYKWFGSPATFTVSFNANGHGTAPAEQSVTSGSVATKPTAPTATGYTFVDWYLNEDCTEKFDFSTPITKDTVLFAKWTVNNYTVTFNANGHGTAPAAQTVTYGKTATQPAAPSASGWTFGGWYTDAACTKAYVFSTAVTGNITLYAKWTAAATPTPVPTPTATPTPAPVSSAQLLVGGGQAHVQDIGDTPVSVDPNTGILTIGTTGQSKRLEEITINFENTTGYEGTMLYRVHVQDYGWLPWTEAGSPAGTEGLSKRIEAIEIKLTGELAKYYSVEYCVHIQDYGDMQGWVKDGALAGTTGESKRIEEIKVRVVPKGTGDTMSVKYRVHIQDIGWESTYATNGAMSGTSGQSKRLEGIEIFLTGTQYSGGIQYKTHIQDIGWESSWAENGEMSGTQGQSKRLEAISIQLTGEVAEYYDIYYRVHAQDIGWMGWAKNGEYAGTAGRSARLEGIQIVLVPKGSPAPGATYEGITANTSAAFVEGF